MLFDCSIHSWVRILTADSLYQNTLNLHLNKSTQENVSNKHESVPHNDGNASHRKVYLTCFWLLLQYSDIT